MADGPRFTRDPDSPSRQRAVALAKADEMLHAALLQARRDQGISQQQVADALGVTQPTIAAFERYDNDPRLSTVRRYAHAVGVVVSHSVTRDGVEVQCGWTPISSSGLFFAVHAGDLARQILLTAPDSGRTDFSLAA